MLSPNSKNNTTSFECIICFEPINVQEACECLECEVAICMNDCLSIEQ